MREGLFVLLMLKINRSEAKLKNVDSRRFVFLVMLSLYSIQSIAEPDSRSIPPLQQEQEQQTINENEQAIKELREEVDNLKQALNSKEDQPPPPLTFSGFFEMTAQSNENNSNTFNLGDVELDLEYHQIENFTASVALVWADSTSEVAAAVLDYHVNNHDVPLHGSLFGEAGYHVQFGRFDIPFGVDYEFFAATDRPNITAPLTTERIENDGFTGDGLRAYGTWSQFDYAVYWTNSLFEDDGTSIGGRIGFFPAKDPFRVHNQGSQRDFNIGLSWLQDLDTAENKRKTLYAIDASLNYGISSLVLEYVSANSQQSVVLANGDFVGAADEKGYSARLMLDFSPIALFVSYGEWKPEFSQVIDELDPAISYRVDTLQRTIIGANYFYKDYLNVKLEYLNHLNTSTEEPGFEKNMFTLQLVATF